MYCALITRFAVQLVSSPAHVSCRNASYPRRAVQCDRRYISCCVTHHHTSTRAHIAYRCSQHSMRHEMLPPREGLQPLMRGGGGGTRSMTVGCSSCLRQDDDGRFARTYAQGVEHSWHTTLSAATTRLGCARTASQRQKRRLAMCCTMRGLPMAGSRDLRSAQIIIRPTIRGQYVVAA